MKILCVIDSLGSGGAQRQLVTLAKLFKRRGDDVRFLTYAPFDFFLEDLSSEHIPVYTIPPVSYGRRIYEVRKYIRQGDQDIVLSFLDTPNFLSCFAAIGGKRWKLVISERSNNESYFRGWRYKIQKYFARYADAIVCNSVAARAVWEKYYPGYQSKLATIHNTVMLPSLPVRYTPLKDGKLHLVVAASYRYLKNTDGLIEAINLLTPLEKEKLVVSWYGNIGSGPEGGPAYKAANEKIRRYKLENSLYLYPATKEILTRMAEADAVGLFSKREGLPNTICEAMRLSKPVVMTRVSDYSLLVDGQNGFLCDSEDPASIRDALRSLLRLSAGQLLEMGNASLVKSLDLFDSAVITEKWITLFRS